MSEFVTKQAAYQPDRKLQIELIARALHKAFTDFPGLGDRPELWLATARRLYDDGLRITDK